MNITVERADIVLPNAVEDLDFSFLIEAYYEPAFGQPVSLWPATPVPAHRKDYRSTDGATEAASDALFLALDKDRPVGRAMISRNWNDYALVDDIAIDVAFRGAGAGRLLMDACVAWSRDQGLAGIMLETQNNNVAACRFYERYGYELGGIDRLLYRGLDPYSREIALFWYLRFGGAPRHGAPLDASARP